MEQVNKENLARLEQALALMREYVATWNNKNYTTTEEEWRTWGEIYNLAKWGNDNI